MKVPFNKIPISGNEIANIKSAMESGILQGDGKFMKVCEKSIREIAGADSALLTTSCTSALDMSALLLDIKEGDEVIVPSYTFVSSVNSFVLRGAKPVFADVRPDTLNIDETKIEELITPRTKAIVPVHYAGVSCEMDAITDIARRRGVDIVEDAAQGFCAYYKNKHLGTFGRMGALSFHSTKNVIAGECGALLVNDPSLVDRANYIREKGTNRIKFIEGKIDKYTWIDLGSSYIPSEIIAAFLAAQLEKAAEFTAGRVEAWKRYAERLEPLAKSGRISLCKIPANCRTNAHIFFISTPDADVTSALGRYLKEREISTNSHYTPLHMSPMAKTLGCADRSLPVAEKMFKTMLRLPMYSSITADEQDWVCDCINAFFE